MASETTTRPKAPPGRLARIVIAAALLLMVSVRLLGRLADPPRPLNDPAVCNLISLILSFVALLTTWIWFCFRSRYSLAVRRAVMFGSPAVIAGSLVLF